jgi:hypothetical protein
MGKKKNKKKKTKKMGEIIRWCGWIRNKWWAY